jgi:hypothetical protein
MAWLELLYIRFDKKKIARVEGNALQENKHCKEGITRDESLLPVAFINLLCSRYLVKQLWL